jgi:hypothetical protein
MNVHTIRKRLSKNGPFVVRTSDGREYLIPPPEFVMVGRYNLVFENEEGGVDIIDPLHVVAIHRASSKGKNGK